MKMRSTNGYYMLGLLPVTILDFGLGMYLARSKWWLVLGIFACCILVCIRIVKKFYCVPYSEASYGEMEKLPLILPVPYKTVVFSCENMARYNFLNRIAEVISPMKWKDDYVKIAVNPVMLKKYGSGFIKIAAVRELKRYETGAAYKTLLLLAIPLEMTIAGVLSVFAFRMDLTAYLGNFFVNVLLPFLMAAGLGIFLFLWNRYISRLDMRLDQYLLQWFSPDEVKTYILVVEELEQKQEREKSHTFSQHYAQERIEKLNCNH